MRKVAEPRAEELARALSDKVLTGKKDQLRDIASIGLKTVIAEIPGGSLAYSTSAIITAKMLEGIAKKVRGAWAHSKISSRRGLHAGCVPTGCT